MPRIAVALVLLFSQVFAQVFTQAFAQDTPPATEQKALDLENNFCETAPTDQLCSYLPHDVTDFSASFVYRLIIPSAQNPFDLFSWKSFIALNWPTDAQDHPQRNRIGADPEAPRVWNHYKNPAQLFDLPADNVCADRPGNKSILVTDEFIQATGQPLIDRNLNYVVYDVRVNPVVAEYIDTNGLESVAGQSAFKNSGIPIEFPMGHYTNVEARTGGSVGALEIKSAWRILQPHSKDDLRRYHTVNGLIAIDGKNTITGEPLCVKTKLGLVGMHIMHRTQSGNGDDWIWTTFEHIDNVPTADNARGPNSIFAEELFPGGCQIANPPENRYSFYQKDCRNCKTNWIDSQARQSWKWSSLAPFAATAVAENGYGVQAVRCWKPSLGTQAINKIWQQKLSGTVWANYQLLTTQWKGANKDLMFPNGEVPRYLTNSTIETYIQTNHDGTCLGCHSTATSTAQQSANFTFVLNRVSPQ